MNPQTNATNWYNMSNPSIATELGTTLKQIRLQQNLSQEQVAQKAGLSRSAISEMENGKTATSLITIIQILRALQQLHLLDNWQVIAEGHPVQTTKMKGRTRLRAGRTLRKHQKEENEWEWL
jgi:transcriptional regulator with XRE-family HTH domain